MPEGFLNQLNAEMNEEEAVRQAKAAETGAAIAGLAVREKPKSAATHANLAAALARAGDYRGAIGEAEEALALDAHQLDAHLLLGQLYWRLPSTSQQAIPHLNAYVQKALRTPENAIPLGEAYGILGDLYRRSAREQQALAKYEEGLKLAPAEPRLWNNAAWLYATAQDTSLRNTERALAYARKAVELSAGKNASYLDTLAEAHYLNGHYDDAVELEKKAIALRPTDQFLKDQLKKLEEAQRAGAAKP